MTDRPPHYILAMMPVTGQSYLEQLIETHLAECVGCQAWREQHPGSDWRSFVSEDALS